MDPLELYAKARDGGPWFLLAAETWALIAAIVALMLTIFGVIFLSARQYSVAGRLLSAILPKRAENLFMRVNIQGTGEFVGDVPRNFNSGLAPAGEPTQAYLASLGTHTMRLYTKFKMDLGAVIKITPPGVLVVVQEIRQISVEPPWFAIEAEPVFRDDVTKRNYRKFLGELSQVA